VQLKKLHIKHFRCFDNVTFDLDSKVVFINGPNGIGKSSLLEALHYLCYLRSFRATSPRELIQFGKDGFFIRAQFSSGASLIEHDLQVGFENKKRLVKLNKKAINSFKELMDHYRVVTLTEDDMAMIKGGPHVRRHFIDQAILLGDPQYAQQVRSFKHVLENRNSLLQSRRCTKESCDLWTGQLWEHSKVVQQRRVAMLDDFQARVNKMLSDTFDESVTVSLSYRSKNDDWQGTFDNFMDTYKKKDLFSTELRYGRSFFGAHLDDIIINFRDKKSKQYASRGQQKLIVLLLKIAHLTALDAQRGQAVLLLDDFMADFDDQRAKTLATFLTTLPNQLIFTSPAQKGVFADLVEVLDARVVSISN